jgi:hypothetical protein
VWDPDREHEQRGEQHDGGVSDQECGVVHAHSIADRAPESM